MFISKKKLARILKEGYEAEPNCGGNFKGCGGNYFDRQNVINWIAAKAKLPRDKQLGGWLPRVR